jgi:hypothetical protein
MDPHSSSFPTACRGCRKTMARAGFIAREIREGLEMRPT